MSKYLYGNKIKEVLESAGFKVSKNSTAFEIYVETDIKDTYTHIQIINMTGRYAFIQVPDKPIAPPMGANPEQFWMDWEEKTLKKSYSGVYRDKTSITILREDCKLVIVFKYGVIYDFQCYKLRQTIPLSSMDSMIGSGCDNLYDEPICARIEDDDRQQ